LNLRKKLLKCYSRSIALYGAEMRTFRKVDQKCLESSKMWCRRRIEKNISADRVRNGVKQKRNILHTIKRKKTN
jgi:hypothetical protein